MKILIGCEESGVVRDAFIAKGHDAASCDLLPTRSPGPHLQMDVKQAIRSDVWDIIILHPDCTALAVSGNAHYGVGMGKNYLREKAIKWTLDLWFLATEASVIGCCLENPVGMLTQYIGKPQYIQPYEFGHDASKKTGLWLDCLPELSTYSMDYVEPRYVNGKPRWGNQTDSGQNKLTPSPTRKRDRSVTYFGIAESMAEQ